MGTAIILSFVLAAPPAAETPPTPKQLAAFVQAVGKDSRPAAQETLKIFQELVNKDNFTSFGLTSLEEVKAVELGHPLAVVLVGLDVLREYKRGGDPYQLLHPIHRVIYPVTVKGEVRSGLEVHAKDGKWAAAGFGLAGAVRLYARARERHATRGTESEYFLVKVPALNEVYLARQAESELRLVRVRAQAEQNKKLEGRPAAEVFEELVPEARKHNGKPR